MYEIFTVRKAITQRLSILIERLIEIHPDIWVFTLLALSARLRFNDHYIFIAYTQFPIRCLMTHNFKNVYTKEFFKILNNTFNN